MKKTTSGFTIVELLIVIIVVGILAVITAVVYLGIQNSANDVAIQSDLRQTYDKVQQFRAINDAWPTSQADINANFVATRKSNGGGANTYLYCRSNDAVAIVARSVSTNGFYHSSVNGAAKMATWPGDSNVALCPAAGIPTTSPGYAAVWIRVNGAWQAWFTPGS